MTTPPDDDLADIRAAGVRAAQAAPPMTAETAQRVLDALRSARRRRAA